MATESINVTFRALGPEEDIDDPEFLDTSAALPEVSTGKSIFVQLVSLSIGDYLEADEPCEAFSADLQDQLLEAARWLQNQPPPLFDALRERGLEADIFVGAWINGDQLDLDLPPEFIFECGKRGLPLSIVTND